MHETAKLRFVKRMIHPDTIHARTVMILQQKWETDEIAPGGVRGGPMSEWRDVPMEEE